jgi:hypothetical protein
LSPGSPPESGQLSSWMWPSSALSRGYSAFQGIYIKMKLAFHWLKAPSSSLAISSRTLRSSSHLLTLGNNCFVLSPHKLEPTSERPPDSYRITPQTSFAYVRHPNSHRYSAVSLGHFRIAPLVAGQSPLRNSARLGGFNTPVCACASLSWGFFPFSAWSFENPLTSGLPHPIRSPFRVFLPLRGFLLSKPSGLVSCRWRSWDSPFRAFSSGWIRNLFRPRYPLAVENSRCQVHQ